MKKKKRLMAVTLLLLTVLCVSLISPTTAATPKLNRTKKTVVKGQSVKLKVKNTTKTVKWSTSNKKVATVKKSGKTGAIVKTKKAGKVTITAKVGSKKLKCKITVKKKSKSDRCDIEFGYKKGIYWSSPDAQNYTIEIKNLLLPYTYNQRFVCDCNKDFSSWESSDTSIISVKQVSAQIAEFTFKKPGNVTISFIHHGKNYKWKVKLIDSDAKYKEKRSQIYQQIGITSSMKPQYKCYLIAKWMCDHITYLTRPDSVPPGMSYSEAYGRGLVGGQTFQEAIDEGTAVCGGYANTFKFLMDGLGIPCEVATGYVLYANHAWNQVQIDGKWYDVDVTFMDPSLDDLAYDMCNFLVSDQIDGRGANNPHQTDTRFDDCARLFYCRLNHKSDNQKMDTSICNKEHLEGLYGFGSSWKDYNAYCPWENGEWINY